MCTRDKDIIFIYGDVISAVVRCDAPAVVRGDAL